MREYKYKPKDSPRKLLYIAIPLIVSIIGIILFIKKGDQAWDYVISHPALFVIYGILLAAGLFALRRTIGKNSRLTVTITIDENRISSNIRDLFARTIERNEVASILETENGTLIVCTANDESIGIPNTIEGYDELRATLQTWRTFTPTKSFKQTFSFYKFFPGIVFVVGLVAGIAVQDEKVSTIFVVLGGAAGIHIFYLLGKLNTTLPQIARLRWFVLFITIMFLLSKLIIPLAEKGDI